MTFQGDPHRTLGVAPGASLNEIKSAYRRLVKQYHPDAAGERALPRFLAIQGAYEKLVDGEGRLRLPSAGRATRREPWRADPSRPRASRDAWRARRSGSGGTAGTTGTSGTASPGAKGAAGPGPAATGSSSAGGADGTGGAGSGPGERPRRERSSREHHARRGPRRATPGSTSYDEAAEPLDPDWDGGAWYGPSSGTYWTLNPREYADPRKHGPEYQARARRATQDPAGESVPGANPEPALDEAAASAASAGAEPDWHWSTDERTDEGPAGSTTSGGAEWGTRSWRYDDVPLDAAPGGRRPRARAAGAAADAPALPDLESLAMRAAPRNLLALARGDARGRLVLALLGWPPIGYAVATLLTELTGCAAFAASCPEPVPVIALAVQPLVVAGLFAVAPAAAVAAFASIVALAVALPVAAILSVGSGPDSRVGAGLLGFAAAGAYLVGLAWGTHAVWRAPRDADATGGASPGT
jgi:curved DNA-binding protein CbpA